MILEALLSTETELVLRATSWVDVVSVPKRVAEAPEVAEVLGAVEEPAVVDAAEAGGAVSIGMLVTTGLLVSSIAV